MKKKNTVPIEICCYKYVWMKFHFTLSKFFTNNSKNKICQFIHSHYEDYSK